MDLRMLFLNLSFLCLIAGTVSKPQFAFYVPCQLQSEQTARGCLDIRNHDLSINVDAFLEVDGVNHTIINEEAPVDFTFKCYDFQVPLVSKAAPVFITINAEGGDFSYIERRAVVVAPAVSVPFIHLNKYMFKGGDTVRCYVFTLQDNFKPVDQTYPTIYVQDPAGNRMFQWLDQKTENGFLKIEFELLDDQDFGSYQITVEGKSSASAIKTFVVEEYVLPKMNLALEASSSITILDKNMSYKASAIYTYGQGVPGKVAVRACRAPTNYYMGNTCNRNPDGLCFHSTGDLDSDGTFSGNLDLTSFQMDRSGYQMGITLQITLTEEGTGIQVTESKYISITSQLARVSFNRNYMQPYYKQGIPYSVEILAEDGVGQPLANQPIALYLNGLNIQNLTTDDDGKTQHKFDTSDLTQSIINIQAIYKNSEQCYDSNWIMPSYSNAYHQIMRFFSRSGSFIQMQSPKKELQLGQTHEIKIQYSFGKELLQEGETTANFVHMVMSRSKIVHNGVHPIDMTTSLKGETTISFTATVELAPEAIFLVYYMSREELVADTAYLSIEKGFANQVSVEFSEVGGIPGSDVNLGITAASESICATRIVDSSLLLMKQGNPITCDSVYSSYQFSNKEYYSSGYNLEPTLPPCIDPNQRVIFNGTYYVPQDSPEEGDVYQLFKTMCLHTYAPNITIHKPKVCGSYSPISFGRPDFMNTNSVFMSMNSMEFNDPGRGNSGIVAPTDSEIVSVRTDFSEIWYNELTHVGESGTTTVPLQVPGTITEWKADMICLSKQSGIGMTKYAANYTAFQPFFVDFTLPTSIVRGEILILRSSVFNYMENDKCAKARVTLHQSDDHTAEAMDETDVKCVCSGQRASFSWKLNALSLGVLDVSVTAETIHIGDLCEGPADPEQPSRKDTVVKPLVVKAEGIRKDVTKSDYVCVNDTSVVILNNILLSENTVADSTKATLTVIGDILGRAVTNPESLNREPTGCGEQTIATLMPIPLVVKYMKHTGLLTDEFEERAKLNMGIGYRKMLSFKNPDGSFGAFAPGRSDWSAWLTLLTFDTFQRLVPHTYVDQTILNQALVKLESLQDLRTGSYEPRGTLFNSALKGGAEGTVSFTAAVVVVLSQSSYAASPTMLRKALEYLDTASRQDQSVYNLAVLFHAFRVTANVERSNAMLEKLKDLAIVEDGTIHWERPIKPERQTPYLFAPKPASAEIEITARVLQALAVGPDPSEEELSYMLTVALYLTSHQSSSGSYRSTSDTMESLKALSAFAALVYQKNTNVAVQVKLADNILREINVNTDNRLLVQTQPLSQIPGNYIATISGTGCVLLQTAVEFNVPVRQENAAFSLSVSTSPESCVNGVAYTIPVQVNVSYNGMQKQSNMALIDLDLLSGYTVEHQSLMELKRQVPKVEQKNSNLIIYLNYVGSDVLSFSLKLEMTAMVLNFQPKIAKAWDYYETAENGAAVMRHPCSNI